MDCGRDNDCCFFPTHVVGTQASELPCTPLMDRRLANRYEFIESGGLIASIIQMLSVMEQMYLIRTLCAGLPNGLHSCIRR